MLAAQPIGCAKVFSYWATVNHCESYGLCASNGILFNHESPRRGETFVSRKISRAVAAIKHGLQHELFLGNLDAKRDWGYAVQYVEGMWRILQHGEGDDFVLATGEAHSVREFAEAAFSHVDLDWKEFVRHDPRYQCPAEVDLLMGDASKAKKILNWEPKVRFHELVRNPPSQAKTSRRVARFRAVKSTLFALSLTLGCLRSRPQVVPEELG